MKSFKQIFGFFISRWYAIPEYSTGVFAALTAGRGNDFSGLSIEGVHFLLGFGGFSRENKATRTLQERLANGKSVLLIWAEATCPPTCRHPVSQPVRFSGGLPISEMDKHFRPEFPVGFIRQDWFVGSPLDSRELARLSLMERRGRLFAALDNLGPPLSEEGSA